MEKGKSMTVNERVKLFREHKKDDKDYRLKENERLKKLKQDKRQKMNEEELKSLREKTAERVRQYRKRKAELNENAATPLTVKMSYTRPQSLGRAVSKCRLSLPYSPNKRKAVVMGLAKEVGIALQTKMDDELKYNHHGFSDELLKTVNDFFYRPDIIYTMPGMKDCMNIYINGKKEKVQKHYLTMFLREAFSLFLETFPDNTNQISYSSFCKLRPANVLLLKDSPSDQCKCKLHENFLLKLKALGVSYDGSWWQSYLCNSNNLFSSCWEGTCSDCSKGELFLDKQEIPDPDKKVNWHQWEYQGEKLVKLQKHSTLIEIKTLIFQEFETMRDHVRVKRIQSTAFEHEKKNSRILQVDFAMGYSCEYQREVQSALWSRSSVTLFTAAVFYKETCKTYLIVSDSQTKDKNTVYTFMFKLFNNIYDDIGIDKSIDNIIFTDGPSSEFKNKYMMKLLHDLSNKFKSNFSWKYFATSHGKGVVDGVGGRAKSLVRQKILNLKGEINVQSASDFYNLIKTLMKSTEILFVSNDEILSFISLYNPWIHIIEFPGIRKMHCAYFHLSEQKVTMFHVSGQQGDPDIIGIYDHIHSEDKVIEPGTWCIVTYDDDNFPGEIINFCKDGDYKVNVMHRGAGSTWKWPLQPDTIFYKRNQIMKTIEPPFVVGSRGQFQFSDELLK